MALVVGQYCCVPQVHGGGDGGGGGRGDLWRGSPSPAVLSPLMCSMWCATCSLPLSSNTSTCTGQAMKWRQLPSWQRSRSTLLHRCVCAVANGCLQAVQASCAGQSHGCRQQLQPPRVAGFGWTRGSRATMVLPSQLRFSLPFPQAGALLDRLAATTAQALGFDDGLPPDDVLASALDWQSRVWFPPR